MVSVRTSGWEKIFVLALFIANSHESVIERHHELCHLCAADDDKCWTYEEEGNHGGNHGPRNWGGDCRNGTQQSPIDINTSQLDLESDLVSPQFENYDKPVTSFRLLNNGHTIQVEPLDDVKRTISVDGEIYTLIQFHFHWGSQCGNGSEHSIDEKFSDMEIHFVHRNSEDELAVVGVLVDEEFFAPNTALDHIASKLLLAKFKNDDVTLDLTLYLQELLPGDRNSFYRYDGSLTTPPCSEGVKWFVAVDPIKIGSFQMIKFRHLLHSAARDDLRNFFCRLVDNYRPIQELNGRPVSLVSSDDNDVQTQ